MKAAARFERTSHGAPAARLVRPARGQAATRVVRVPRHATKRGHARQRRYRRLRRLLVLFAIVGGGWWAFGQVSGLGEATATMPAHRLKGGNAAAPTSGGLALTPRPRGGALGGASLQPATTATVRAAASATPGPSGTATPAPALPPATATSVAATQVTHTAPALPPTLPAAKLLHNDYQVFETWNDCGPASLSMALSYFGIQESQATLADLLRPYQNAQGNNDDKDVTMDELAAEARTFGLLAYHRPGGTIGMIKRFVAAGMPVIAETVLTSGDDIGHFRVVKGYDDNTGSLTQDDSMQGHNVSFPYADFQAMWKSYNYEYLVLVPRSKQKLAEAILGSDLQPRIAWARTAVMDQASLSHNPSDIDSRFNLSVALYYIGDYKGSVRAFEQVQSSLPFRTLWYQIEPIEAYYRLGNYQKVFALTDTILNNGNRAFSQLYLLRGTIDIKQGNITAARAEFANAVLYNKHLKAALAALRSVTP